MFTSFLKNRKKSNFPMKSGVTCSLIFVENFSCINCIVALLISEFSVTSQRVKESFFNIGFSIVANTLKPLRGLKYSPFFISKILKHC